MWATIDTTFPIVITDVEEPTIKSCPLYINQTTDVGQPTALVTWGPLVASDNSEETPSVTCTPTPESSFDMGPTGVRCEATDSSRNQAICEFNVLILGK